MITSKFTEFIVSTSYDQLPDDVIQKAKECFTDFVGVALRGSETESGEAVKNIIRPGGESTVIGQGRSTPMEAGLANGIFAHSMDLDDGHRLAMLHPGACVIPAALSLCEAENRTGKELIESIVVGYQVVIALGMMVNPGHRSRGFHSTGTCGTIGAAAAASKAMSLNEEEIANALGLAGTQAAGLLESDHSGSMGKHLHTGRAAQSGILSALLARNGFTGGETILEGDEGFLKAMTDIDPNAMTDIDPYTMVDAHPHETDLPMENYHISDVYFKIYPVCRHLHSSIDALLEIVKENQLELEEIEKITVNTYKIAAEHDDYHPTSTEALRQSLPVSMAVALLNHYQETVDLIEFSYSPPNQKEINDISGKIQIKIDSNLDKQYPQSRPSEVTIFTEKGIYKNKVDLPQGEPENPLKQGVEWKFRNLNPDVDARVLDVIGNMDSYPDVRQFMGDLNSFLKI
ncbi:MAG: MmgE/PrpD family protein [Methanobacteriaceae archaeon]|jgi:2-methylcitrate dehydratase PrpD|nr:MmgE/PrpD family protein [Methanobacteriaceae archaeon]